jgi:uncharacterized metal-binding protein YceD (DUF177 family)
MLKGIFNRMRQRRATRTCMAQRHVVPQEATEELRQTYLGGNVAPSVSYECARCGRQATTQYLPGTAVDPRRRIPF